MNPVGVRELKARLSEYIERATGGEEILVMLRGKPVVRLVPLEEDDVMARGLREGWLKPPLRPGGVRPYGAGVPDSQPGGASLIDEVIRDRDRSGRRSDDPIDSRDREVG